MTTHAMIDLETLGTGPDCVVLTIGGVKFNPNEISDTHNEFYYRFDVDEQLAKGRTTLDSTIEWWGRQEKSVRDEALGDEGRTSVLEVLQHLNKWCVGVDVIWCQGPAFDIVILENMYQQYKHHVPWAFWKIRDSRTLFSIMPSDPRKEIEFAAHNALEDCKVQALCVQQSIGKLKLKLK
jgi:exodeoxyribonuclease VIII|tara:strand:- start:287 stop:826 length:540 start_codon:yes stop_codon:yes gene_type:complete